MISDISFRSNTSSKTAAETTNSAKDILINQLQIDGDELIIELDKVHRLPLNSTKTQYKKQHCM